MAAIALQNMINNQIRPAKVRNERVINAFVTVPRKIFLPIEYQALAYADLGLPIGKGRTMLPPQEQAYILQTLDIQASERILEIGTGCGYFTALLAQLGHLVYSVDVDIEFIDKARHNLAALAIHNVHLLAEDVLQHWQKVAEQGPFDVIVSNSAFYDLPQFLLPSLSSHGRLFVIIGKAPTMSASLFKRQDNSQHWEELSLFETIVAYTPNLKPPETFIF